MLETILLIITLLQGDNIVQHSNTNIQTGPSEKIEYCEYLYNSGQGTEKERLDCANDFIIIDKKMREIKPKFY